MLFILSNLFQNIIIFNIKFETKILSFIFEHETSY